MSTDTTSPKSPDRAQSGAGANPRKADLTVEIVDGRLVIAIGVEALGIAVEGGPAGSEWNATVIDADRFAVELRTELLAESEAGTTPIHKAFDEAAAAAIEAGAEGVQLAGEESDDER